MENFVVSARKYRPATFDTVVGQGHITTTLKNAIKTNHLAQAFLFCGPRGVGKTTCARILAKTINCETKTQNTEACGQCASCKSFENQASLAVFELDAASNNSVDDIRSLIDQVRYPPSMGTHKVYIIDEVHMLSTSAFNAFLKTLEEPPSYAIFILATTEKSKILPTILSRCQIFDFNRIVNSDISSHLAKIAASESISFDDRALELIAQKADGGLRDALSMFDLNVTFAAGRPLSYEDVLENLHVLDYDYYFKIADQLFTENFQSAIILLDEILNKGFDAHLFLNGLLDHFRCLMLVKDPATAALLDVSDGVKKQYVDQAASIPLSFIMSVLSVGTQLDLNFRNLKNQRLHLEVCLMKLSQIRMVLDLDQVSEKTTISVPKTEPAVADRGEAPIKAAPKMSGFKSTKNILKESIEASQPVFEDLSNTIKPLISLEEAWKLLKIERTSITEQVMFDRPFKLADQTIHIVLDNDTQERLLNEIKVDIMESIRTKTGLKDLNIAWTIAETVKSDRPYTAEEKYEYLLKKNPYIELLKERFEMDLGR